MQVTADGLADDTIVDTRNHGGPDQAVYIYGGTDYAWWSVELGRELAPGMFGENLTISDLESAPLAIGDRLHSGGVILEVTAPRIPCWKLAQRMGDPGFVKRFRAAERPGAYCRVVRVGSIRAGEPVTLVPYAGERVTVAEIFRDYYEPAMRSGRHPPLSRRAACGSRALRKGATSSGNGIERMQTDE